MSKEKLTDSHFFLVINGPSCGGKSSVSDILFEKYGGIYKGKSDVIKWLISDYNANLYRDVVHLMTLETIRVALSHGLSVIKEGGWEPEKYLKMAEEYRVPFFMANISAPWEVLISRFAARRIEAKEQGRRIANTDPKRFKELYDIYIDTKMKTELEFDSSMQGPAEIAEAITFYIRKFNKASY